MQDPRIQELKNAHQELRKKIDNLLEAHRDAIAAPGLSPSEISALTTALDSTLEKLYEEMHGIAETLEGMGVTIY